MKDKVIEVVPVASGKRFVIKKTWYDTAWRYRVFKESTILGFIWVGGWDGDNTGRTKGGLPTYTAPFFDTLEEARRHCARVKENLLSG